MLNINNMYNSRITIVYDENFIKRKIIVGSVSSEYNSNWGKISNTN